MRKRARPGRAAVDHHAGDAWRIITTAFTDERAEGAADATVAYGAARKPMPALRTAQKVNEGPVTAPT